MKTFPAVIKWSGSKRTVAAQLAEKFIAADTYFEPFVGGGAMMPYAKAAKGYASDIIPELIDLWNKNTSRYRCTRIQIEMVGFAAEWGKCLL